MISEEDYRALEINFKRMEREIKVMRQTLLDDFAKAAIIAMAPDMWCQEKFASVVWDCAEEVMKERDKRYGTR